MKERHLQESLSFYETVELFRNMSSFFKERQVKQIQQVLLLMRLWRLKASFSADKGASYTVNQDQDYQDQDYQDQDQDYQDY